jgi:hypothetical protein
VHTEVVAYRVLLNPSIEPTQIGSPLQACLRFILGLTHQAAMRRSCQILGFSLKKSEKRVTPLA